MNDRTKPGEAPAARLLRAVREAGRQFWVSAEDGL